MRKKGRERGEGGKEERRKETDRAFGEDIEDSKWRAIEGGSKAFFRFRCNRVRLCYYYYFLHSLRGMFVFLLLFKMRDTYFILFILIVSPCLPAVPPSFLVPPFPLRQPSVFPFPNLLSNFGSLPSSSPSFCCRNLPSLHPPSFSSTTVIRVFIFLSFI